MRNFHLAGRSTVHSMNGMAASSHPLATLTAIEVLKAGGTAADAAVAACALQGVIEPQSTGIGGDCFALIQPKGEGKVHSYNGSGRAPKAATAEWYMERKMFAIPGAGPHSVTIPGAIDAWATILGDHGKFGLDAALQPAIKAAEEGYVVAPRIAFDWKNNLAKVRAGVNAPRYLLKNNEAPVTGDVMKQPELGQTMRTIAKLGPDGFYKGYVAEDMVQTLRGAGGLHTMEDFAGHTTERTTPLSTNYKGYDVWQCPPNGPGITMLVMLNILSHFDLTKYPAMSVERFHLEAEAARIAYLMREQDIGDPAHVTVDHERILSKQFAADWAAKIRMDALVELPDVSPPANPDTVYITVIDKDRSVCSFINSVAHSFGSAVVSEKTGVLLQNRGVGFRVQPGHPTCIAPGKRPLHTIIPSMTTENGRAKMSFAVMGGQYQPVGQTHVLTNMLDYGMDVQEAIDQPRALHYEGIYQLESGISADIADGLAKIGHTIGRPVAPWGGAQAIWIDWEKGTLTGGSDPRKDGCALGY
jgi:gamma-glutamyltranspeptidase / glutathione hydrolase